MNYDSNVHSLLSEVDNKVNQYSVLLEVMFIVHLESEWKLLSEKLWYYHV